MLAHKSKQPTITAIMAVPNVNDFSHISNTETATWVSLRLDTGDGLIEDIAPAVYTLTNLEGLAQTHFGPFLGSVALEGYAGLRPITPDEMESVLESIRDNPSGSASLERLTVPAEEAWRNFLGRSTQDMMGRIVARVTGQPMSKIYPTEKQSDDAIYGHFIHVANVISPNPVEINVSTPGSPDGIDNRVDVLELFGIDRAHGSGEREDLARIICEVNSSLDRLEFVANRATLITEPLTAIIEGIGNGLPEINI